MPLSMSPRTQQLQMGQGAGVDQATAMFERGFSDMSYNVLTNKFPDLIPDVVTFKVIDTNLEKGVGVGAFVIMRGERPLYVPVVMSENAIKPLELVYDKALNVFLPLSKGWLNELDKTQLSSLGKGVKTPETLYSDVDLRNIVVPPITGRFSYAAWEPVILAHVQHLFTTETLEKTASEPSPMLLSFLSAAPNYVKLAFTKVLKENKGLLKHAVASYGVSSLTDALAFHAVKVAATQHHGGALWIAGKDTPATEFKRVFGDQAAEAFAGVKTKGYAAKDSRPKHNQALTEQTYQHWVEPRQPGVYILEKTDGTKVPALVIPNPIALDSNGMRYSKRDLIPGRNPLHDNSYTDPTDAWKSKKVYENGRVNESDLSLRRKGPEFLAVLSGGDYLMTDRLAGQLSVADALSGEVHKRIFKDNSGAPKAGKGVWIRQKGTTLEATQPIEIISVTTDSSGERRIKFKGAEGWGTERTLITTSKMAFGTIHIPKDSHTAYLPADFVWVPLKSEVKKGDLFTSPLAIADHVQRMLVAAGAKKVSIKNAGADQFSIDGKLGLDRIEALRKVAATYELRVNDAAALLEKAASERHIQFWVISPETLVLAQRKLAAEEGGDKDKKPKKKSPPSESRGGGAEQDPGMEGGDEMGGDPMAEQAMMAAAQPPEPSPTDLAAMEMDQHIQQEIQKLQEKQQMLVMLTQRANEIAGGAPMMPTAQTQAMGAPPPSQNLATGAMAPGGGMPPGGAPMPGGMGGPPPMQGGGMDPMSMGAAPGSALPGGGGMGGMDPSMMGGGGMGGMDPSMMGGMDPMQGGMQQPSMAMMGPDGPTAEGLASEINPQFLNGAAQLPGGDMFDAAAVASLAQSPAIKELVSQYLPNLEKAVDNLGRVLLSVEMQEPDLKEEIGEASFTDLEENLRSTLRGLGDLVLHLSQSAHIVGSPNDHATA